MVLAHVLEYTCVMVFHYVIYGVIVSVCYGVCCVMVLTCVMVFAWVMVFFRVMVVTRVMVLSPFIVLTRFGWRRVS